tara:strand:- start:1628 stop:1852 length:225 start_codon:yes stop_codon:yes gene_type:complete
MNRILELLASDVKYSGEESVIVTITQASDPSITAQEVYDALTGYMSTARLRASFQAFQNAVNDLAPEVRDTLAR